MSADAAGNPSRPRSPSPRQIVALVSCAIFVVGGGSGLYASWGLPGPAGVALVILSIAATLWITEAIPLFVTSFVVLLGCLVWLRPALAATGAAVEPGLFLGAFFSDVILLFLGGFVLSAGLHKFGIDELVARWIIARTGRSLPTLMLGVMAITAFLSMWLSNTATAAMMLALMLPIVGSLPEDDRYRKALLLCIPFAANVGGLGTPIGSPPNAIAMQYLQRIDAAPGFATWLVLGLPAVAGVLVFAWGLLLIVERGTTRDVPPLRSGPPLVRSQGFYLVVGVAALPVGGWMTGALHGYSAGTVALLPVILFFGAGILDVKDLRALSWDVLLLMGGGLCLGTAISTSGLADWLVARLPVAGASASELMIVFGVVGCLMSAVMSNTATANLIMPIVLGLDVEPISPVLIGVAFACSLAMPLPVSTPPNAMAFSSGELTVSDMMRTGTVITVVGLELTFTIGRRWWDLIGLF